MIRIQLLSTGVERLASLKESLRSGIPGGWTVPKLQKRVYLAS